LWAFSHNGQERLCPDPHLFLSPKYDHVCCPSIPYTRIGVLRVRPAFIAVMLAIFDRLHLSPSSIGTLILVTLSPFGPTVMWWALVTCGGRPVLSMHFV